jgi:predicted amidohydrolase YtcJ
VTTTGTVATPVDRLITGRIASLAGDRGFGWRESIAIGSGRVVAVGRARDLECLAGPSTRRWSLPDSLAITPGITDAHLHLVTASQAATQVDLGPTRDLPAALDRIRATHRLRLETGDADGWLLGHGWSLDQFRRWPTADDLEAAAPGRPIALWAHDHHARWVSGAALDRARITAESLDPPGGAIRRDANRVVTGILHENAATLVDRAIPRPTAKVVSDAIAAYARELLLLGITGVHDPGELLDEPDAAAGPWLFADLAAAGRLPLRVVGSIRHGQLARAVAWGMRSGRSNGRYTDGWLKLFADGSLGSRSAALLEPYEPGDPKGPPVGGERGMQLQSSEYLHEAARQAAESGIAVQIHAIGDAAVRTALDVLERLPTPAGGVHHRIEHAQLVAPRDVPRFAALGIAASIQPCHRLSDAVAQVDAWGERWRHTFPIAALAESGALLAFGTDAPVEPADPWRNLAAAACADAIDGPGAIPVDLGQLVPLWRAIRAATVDPARTIGSNGGGRLIPGSPADFLVVPAAPLLESRPDAASVRSMRPLAALLDGDVVQRGDAFDLD